MSNRKLIKRKDRQDVVFDGRTIGLRRMLDAESKPPTRVLLTAVLATVLLAMSWIVAPIIDRGGPAPCTPVGSACQSE
jgi:hypothetical protein